MRLYRGRVANQIIDDLRGQLLSGPLADGARLRAAAEHAANAEGVRDSTATLQAFFLTLAEISHNPLLAADLNDWLRANVALGGQN